MATPEQQMFKRLSASAGQYAVFQRHEDQYQPDIPDVSFVLREGGQCGWIELKTIEKWSTTITKLPHLSPGQVNWLKARSQLGNLSYLLLWVRRENAWLWIAGKDLTHDMIDVGLSREDWLRVTSLSPFSWQHVLATC